MIKIKVLDDIKNYTIDKLVTIDSKGKITTIRNSKLIAKGIDAIRELDLNSNLDYFDYLRKLKEEGKMKGRMKELEDLIRKYSHYYYVENKSLISNREFDLLLEELEKLEEKYPQFKSKDSPTERVGSDLTSSTFEKVEHKYPMLSLSNTYNKEDITRFYKAVKKVIPKPVFILEFKFDGVSISLDYEDSKLIRAVTRGDGKKGEDVTENVKTISDIPHIIRGAEPFTATVRGEIVMPNDVFMKINAEREEAGMELFMNPRNTTSGTLKQHDPSVVKYRQLESKMYYVYGEDFKTQEEVLHFLEAKKFNTGNYYICHNVDEIMETLDKMDTFRKNMDIDTDGIVIKVNDMSKWDELGFTSKAPKYAIAFKFETIKVSTKLLSVVWQVGRSGKITPVANLRTVLCSGSRVSRSTLHNYDFIEERDIRVGDTVTIEKAAEIVPQIVSVVKHERTGDEMVIQKPTVCPECGEPVHEEEKLVGIWCRNPHCGAKLGVSVSHLVSSEALNIKDFGPSLIEKLLEDKTITKLTDIYRLPKLFKNSKYAIERKVGLRIEESVNNDPIGLLIGLGIPSIGKAKALDLLKKFCSIDKILVAAEDELAEVVGGSSAGKIVTWRKSPRTKEILDDLRVFKVNLKSNKCEVIDGVFNDLTFILTGTMSIFADKKEIKTIITKQGGKIGSSVSKKTDYVIYGDKAGGKLEKAEELGIKCLSEKEFKNLAKDKGVL